MNFKSFIEFSKLLEFISFSFLNVINFEISKYYIKAVSKSEQGMALWFNIEKNKKINLENTLNSTSLKVLFFSKTLGSWKNTITKKFYNYIST